MTHLSVGIYSIVAGLVIPITGKYQGHSPHLPDKKQIDDQYTHKNTTKKSISVAIYMRAFLPRFDLKMGITIILQVMQRKETACKTLSFRYIGVKISCTFWYVWVENNWGKFLVTRMCPLTGSTLHSKCKKNTKAMGRKRREQKKRNKHINENKAECFVPHSN